MLNEDHTAARLKGEPIFCVNRTYDESVPTPMHKVQYKFAFDNGYCASIVELMDDYKSYYNYRYELAYLSKEGKLDHSKDLEQGDEFYMNELLNEIEKL